MMHQVKARVARGMCCFGALHPEVACEGVRGYDTRVAGKARGKIGEQGSGDAGRSAAGGGDARYLKRGGRETQVSSPSS